MKQVIRIFAILFLFSYHAPLLFAQSPQLINYQAVVRDASGSVIANHLVSIRFSIHDTVPSGPIVYQETAHLTSNSFGLVATTIGSQGNLATVDWGNGLKFLQIEIDPTGADSFMDMGTSQLTSVPYALFAGNSAPGPTGAMGPCGAAGISGATGAVGPSGSTGANGVAGNTGAVGATGLVGVTGTTGPAGIDGLQGPTGVTGLAGATGAVGMTGPTGLQGLVGITGPSGSDALIGLYYCENDTLTTRTLFQFPVTRLSLTIPPGNYILTAYGELSNSGYSPDRGIWIELNGVRMGGMSNYLTSPDFGSWSFMKKITITENSNLNVLWQGADGVSSTIQNTRLLAVKIH